MLLRTNGGWSDIRNQWEYEGGSFSGNCIPSCAVYRAKTVGKRKLLRKYFLLEYVYGIVRVFIDMKFFLLGRENSFFLQLADFI